MEIVFLEMLTEDAVILTAGVLLGVLLSTLIVVFGSHRLQGSKRGE